MKIEFITEEFSWDKGYITAVIEEDEENYYFYDVYNRWCYIEKNKQGKEFLIHG